MKKILALIFLALLVACATNENFRQARIEVEAGNEEAGLAQLEAELKKNPQDTELRNYYQRHKGVAVQRYIAVGDNARAAGASDRAMQSYERALRFDPENQRAKIGVQLVRKDREHRTLLADADQAFNAGQMAEAQGKLKQVLAENPQNREARTLLRRIEERQVKETTTPQLNAAL
ncbi:MAG TPA: hypothetical protein VGJ74_22025, partial [Burkholderiales bacterium]